MEVSRLETTYDRLFRQFNGWQWLTSELAVVGKKWRWHKPCNQLQEYPKFHCCLLLSLSQATIPQTSMCCLAPILRLSIKLVHLLSKYIEVITKHVWYHSIRGVARNLFWGV